MNNSSLPPFRDLTSQQRRERHLLVEIGRASRPYRALVAAVAVTALIASAPTLAFSSTLRELVGLKSSPPPELVATLTGATVQHRQTVDLVTVRFTVGERGKRPGTGIPPGSEFLVSFLPARGSPAPQLVTAVGSNGHYKASAFVRHGGIRGIEIAGWLNRGKGSPIAADGLFLPITVVSPRR